MVEGHDWALLLIVALLTLATTGVFVVASNRRSLKTKFAVVGAGYFVYSGFGLASFEEGSKYLIPYLIYLLILNGSILTVAGSSAGFTPASASDADTVDLGAPWWNQKPATWLATGYVISLITLVVFGKGGIGLLFDPIAVFTDVARGQDIFLNRLSLVENPLYSVLKKVQLLLLPFFYIEMQRRLDRRWGLQLIVLIGLAYLGSAIEGYWGRVGLISPFLIWLFILMARQGINRARFLAGFLGLFLLVPPVFLALRSWQSGVDSDSTNGYWAQFLELLSQETFYPNYYPIAEYLGNSGLYSLEYIKWILLIPVRWLGIGNDLAILTEFSEEILGIPYGGGGFYVLLPSWLGEGLMIFGSTWYWVAALIAGTVIGLLDRFLSLRPELISYNAYISFLLLFHLRGSSQGFIGQSIHSLWVLIFLYFANMAVSRPRTTRSQTRENASKLHNISGG